MFPLLNYGVGFNSRFPDPKPIRSARPGGHIIAKDEPIMSGNDLAAAAVALAASCVIMFFAFRKGKSDKVIKAISGASPTTPPPSSSAASALVTLPTGGSSGGGGSAVASAISHEPVAHAASSHSASHVSGEPVPVGVSELERPAADATAEAGRVPVTDTPAESHISELDGEPSLPSDSLAEPLAEPPSGIPVGDTSGKPSSLAQELSDVVNTGLDPRTANAAGAKGAPDAAAGAAASAKPVPPPSSGKAPTPPTPKVVERNLPNGEKLVIKTSVDGGEHHLRYDFQGREIEKSRYEKGQLVERSRFRYEYEEEYGCEIQIEEKIKVVNGKEVAPAKPKPPSNNSGGTPPNSSTPPAPPNNSVPPAPPAPAAGASSPKGNVNSKTSLAQTQAATAAMQPHTPPARSHATPVPPKATTSGTNPPAAASSVSKVPRTYADYEAEFEKGARAYIASLAQTSESAAKLDEAMQAWGHLDKIPNLQIRAIFQGQCHELMRNYNKAIASYKEAGAIDRLQKLQKDVDLPAGVFEQAEDAIAEISGAVPRARQPVQVAEPNSAQPNASSAAGTAAEPNTGFEGNVDDLLAKLSEEPFEEAVDPSKPPHPGQVYAEIFGKTPPVTHAVARAKPLPPRFANASPDVLAVKLFGTPTPIVIDAATALSKMERDGNETYRVAVKLYNEGHKAAANGQFAKAMGILEPLLAHDTDGRYLNAVGQCLQGMGRHEEAMERYMAAVEKGHKKAMECLGIYLETGAGIEGGAKDLPAAVDMYIRGGAKEQLKRLSNKADLPQELAVQVKAALDQIESASQAVVSKKLGHPTTVAPPALMN